MPAVALTDHGNIFGAVEFFRKAKARDIKPILGCEVYIAPRSRFDKEGRQDETHHFHLVLLVKDAAGYQNLCRLLSKGYIEGFYYKPRIDKELLSQHSQGLIGLSSCLKGEIAFLLGRGMDVDAEKAALEYASFFPKGDFYIELQDHGLPPQKEVNPKLIALARKHDLPLVVTNDMHFLRKEDAESHDVLLCIQTNKKVSDTDRIRFSSAEFYFKPAGEMMALFKDVPDAIQNTGRIAAQCDFSFPLGSYFLPTFDAPGGMTPGDYFVEVARQGFRQRMEELQPKFEKGKLSYPVKVYEERLEREIKLIKQMKFEGYFLIVWDLIRQARSRGIPVGPGRGSAAGSLLAYSLGITDIDPIEYDLLFERFLNPERISLPDIDIDFCGRRRGEVIEYVTNRYGRENVCQIITFGTMAARLVIRDVGRALEVPLPEVDRIAKMIPSIGPDATIESALKKIPQLQEMSEKNDKIAHLLSVAQRLEGQVRHPSIHAAGIVITPRPLVEFIPLYQSVKGEITTQFQMGDIEAIGLLKMDLLGLRNLTVIQDALVLIEREEGVTVDLKNIPLDDPETFALFQAGATDGVFQFESPGMKDLLRNFKPEAFRDLIALNALYRPGPLKSGMTNEFVQRKNHPERTSYEFPELEPVLKETRGIIVYQEQVMKIATELAGFSLAEADLLRKAMGKKITEIMKSQMQRFIQGAKKKGISQKRAEKIFELIKNFAEYGFNKSHSAAYAYLAYQTAYLKAHYPAHFMAALLTSEAERGDPSQVVKYINECQDMGLKVLPPDINESEFPFTVVNGQIRFGLLAVKNVGEAPVVALLEERKRRGRFASPFELVENADPRILNRKVLESLIKAGALDSLGWRRSQSFHLVEQMIEYGHEIQKLKAARQNSLFGNGALETPGIPVEVREMREWDESLFLSYENDVLGFYITGHPLAQYKNLKRLVSHYLEDLDSEKDFGSEVRVAGIITTLKLRKTKKEESMATFMLEDLTGRMDVVVFPEAYRKSMEHLRDGAQVWLKGKFVGDGENRKIQLLQVMPLADAFLNQARRVIIRVFLPGIEETVFGDLKKILEQSPGDCPVFFDLEMPLSYRLTAQSIEIRGVAPTDGLTKSIENLLGENSVWIEY
jgi:DNA polymerase-3 subunit alpha